MRRVPPVKRDGKRLPAVAPRVTTWSNVVLGAFFVLWGLAGLGALVHGLTASDAMEQRAWTSAQVPALRAELERSAAYRTGSIVGGLVAPLVFLPLGVATLRRGLAGAPLYSPPVMVDLVIAGITVFFGCFWGQPLAVAVGLIVGVPAGVALTLARHEPPPA